MAKNAVKNKTFWDNKDERAQKAVDHATLMADKYAAEIQEIVENSHIVDWTVGDCDYSKRQTVNVTKITVENLDSVSAVFKYSHPDEEITAVLNFASFKNPGGRFLEGSKAQEESLCHESVLYNVLSNERFADFYEWNKGHLNKAMYQDRGIYSENVIFERDSMTYADVITCACPNYKAASMYKQVSEEENTKFLRSRINFVLYMAEHYDADNVILGAFGCGVFGQDPVEVASIFKEYLEGPYKNVFRKVIFAIPKGSNDENLYQFQRVFGARTD